MACEKGDPATPATLLAKGFDLAFSKGDKGDLSGYEDLAEEDENQYNKKVTGEASDRKGTIRVHGALRVAEGQESWLNPLPSRSPLA